MAQLAFDNDFGQLNNLSIQESFKKIAEVYYPQLQLRLKLIGESITSEAGKNTAAEKAILLRIKQELNSMEAKEQMLLLPLLIVLERERKETDDAPFNLAKKHYRSVCSCLRNLRSLFIAGKEPFGAVHLITEQVNDLERELVQLQLAKEKYLFNKFKNCSSHKIQF